MGIVAGRISRPGIGCMTTGLTIGHVSPAGSRVFRSRGSAEAIAAAAVRQGPKSFSTRSPPEDEETYGGHASSARLVNKTITHESSPGQKNSSRETRFTSLKQLCRRFGRGGEVRFLSVVSVFVSWPPP